MIKGRSEFSVFNFVKDIESGDVEMLMRRFTAFFCRHGLPVPGRCRTVLPEYHVRDAEIDGTAGAGGEAHEQRTQNLQDRCLVLHCDPPSGELDDAGELHFFLELIPKSLYDENPERVITNALDFRYDKTVHSDGGSLIKCLLDLCDDERLDDVSDLKVVELLDADAALHAG